MSTDNDTRTLSEKVLAALDGPYRELRDDTHMNPHAVLVFDEKTLAVEAVQLSELPLRYPVCGPGARCSCSCLGALVNSKALLYRQSRVAHELHDEDPTSQAQCGTPVLAVPERPGPYCWFEMKARMLPKP